MSNAESENGADLRSIRRIAISKREAVLRAFGEDDVLLLECAALCGRRPGAKECEGDERTPEGTYFVCVKNPRSRFHLSLGLSYPNEVDARRALAAGRIDANQYAAVETAAAARRRPPWDTPLGGEIYIHGDAEGRSGTRGCIAVANAAIEKIYADTEIGTPVVIVP